MRYALLGLLVAGCGSDRTLVATHAETIEELTSGQRLLAAGPIGDDYRFQIVGGASMAAGAGSGEDASTLEVGRAVATGMVTIALGHTELGYVHHVAATRADGAPKTWRPQRHGLRARFAPGNETVRFGISFEGGLRNINIARGESEVCDAQRSFTRQVLEPDTSWRQRADEGDCWVNDERVGEAEMFWRPYLATTFYPTFSLGDFVYLYAGLAVDSAAVGYTEEEIYLVKVGGRPELEDRDSDLEYLITYQIVGGVDVRLGAHLGLIATVRGQPLRTAARVNLPGPSFDGALSVRF